MPQVQTPSYAPAAPHAQPAKRSLVLPIVGALLVVLLLVGGVGAFFVLSRMGGDTKTGDKPETITSTGGKGDKSDKTKTGTTSAAASTAAESYRPGAAASP